MKNLNKQAGRTQLGRVSQATKGNITGVIEAFGLERPQIQLS